MSEQNAEQIVTYYRVKRKVKRKDKSPLNDTTTNNGHTHSGTQVSSRKGGTKGKQTLTIINLVKIIKAATVHTTVYTVQRTLVSAFWTLVKTHL